MILSINGNLKTRLVKVLLKCPFQIQEFGKKQMQNENHIGNVRISNLEQQVINTKV